MLQKARGLMMDLLVLKKTSQKKFESDEQVTVLDKVMVLCLLVYYLHPAGRVRNYILRFMEQNYVRLNQGKRDGHLSFANDESEWATKTGVFERICILLTGEFELSLRSHIGKAKSEDEIEAVAFKIYEEYFVEPIPA